MVSLGQSLAHARESKGLSVEDVAHRTRIHPKLIESLESGDYSVFPSPAYARSFVRSYSQFLGIDLSEEMDELPLPPSVAPAALAREKGRLREKIGQWRRSSPAIASPRTSDRKKAPLLLNVVLGMLIISMSLFYFLGFSVSSIEEAHDRLRMTGEALMAPHVSEAPAAVREPAAADGDNAPEAPVALSDAVALEPELRSSNQEQGNEAADKDQPAIKRVERLEPADGVAVPTPTSGERRDEPETPRAIRAVPIVGS